MNAWARHLAVAVIALGTVCHGQETALAQPGAGPSPDCPGEAMAPAMLEAYVKGIQRELAIHNYDPGPPEGTLSVRTRRAIHEYQRDAGLPVDGCVDQALLDHLNFVLPKVTRPRPAAAKPVVIEVQTLLTRRGYALGSVDGVAGSKTRAALRRFQEDARLAVGGPIDEALLERIKSADPGIRGDREPPSGP
jgi:peptidoglycan hydrolase-like protein with peptidoglycan-binding domain